MRLADLKKLPSGTTLDMKLGIPGWWGNVTYKGKIRVRNGKYLALVEYDGHELYAPTRDLSEIGSKM